MQAGNIDYLVSDYLSEITMSLLTSAKQKSPVSVCSTRRSRCMGVQQVRAICVVCVIQIHDKYILVKDNIQTKAATCFLVWDLKPRSSAF